MLEIPNSSATHVQPGALEIAAGAAARLYPERGFADALYLLWEVDQGTRQMSPQEATQLWEGVKRDIDHYKAFEARLESLMDFYAKEIGKIRNLLDFTGRYLKGAMRRYEMDVIEGEHYKAVLGQNVYYRVMDNPTVEDLGKYPEAVDTVQQWKSEKPAPTLLNEIAEVVRSALISENTVSDEVAAVRKKIAALIFADQLQWKRSGSHKLIDSIIKDNPQAIARDRYDIKISDTLTVRLKGNGRAKTKSKSPAAIKGSGSGECEAR